jgi:RNA polymerase sigma-70 factor (sigma-E family)
VVTSQQVILPVDDGDTVPVVDVDHGFDAFVRDHARSLARSAFLLTGDRQLAEDLVQTALAKVALRWSRVVAGGDPAPYVRVVVVRTAIAWRRRRWHSEVPTSPVPDAASRDAVTAVAARDRLQRALQLVPPRQRAAVVLRFYEDLTEADTARVMGCSVGTVKSQTAKALSRLRQILGDELDSINQEDDA